MLILSRRLGQSIRIGESITVRIVDVRGGTCGWGSSACATSRCIARKSRPGSRPNGRDGPEVDGEV